MLLSLNTLRMIASMTPVRTAFSCLVHIIISFANLPGLGQIHPHKPQLHDNLPRTVRAPPSKVPGCVSFVTLADPVAAQNHRNPHLALPPQSPVSGAQCEQYTALDNRHASRWRLVNPRARSRPLIASVIDHSEGEQVRGIVRRWRAQRPHNNYS